MINSSTLKIGSLELKDPQPEQPVPELEYFTATVMCNGLQATSKVYAFMSQGLAELLKQLAAEWKGWSGIRSWESLENDLKLSFSHDGLGHVTIVVELSSESLHKWTVRVKTSIDAGELEALARQAKNFLRV
jgi:hypothetical protein